MDIIRLELTEHFKMCSEFTKLAENFYHSFQWFVGNPHDTIAHMGWTKFVCDNDGKYLVCMLEPYGH